LELEKGQRQRADEERIVSRLVLNQISHTCGLEPRLDLELLPTETVQSVTTEARPQWRDLLLGRIQLAAGGGSGDESGPPGTKAVFPGAFNPLHEGHRRMAALAGDLLGVPVAFELSIDNVDKPPLDFTEIELRLAQFADDAPLWLTRAATFADKSAIFPGTTFVVGADTVSRIGDPQYYGGSSEACRAAIELIARRGCRMLVFGRVASGGERPFLTLDDLPIPDDLADLCRQVPESQFRSDISSTELRQRGHRN
jgi:nicotinic acid mononucleotide adenylyltransferase